jgi:hypothetical protein
VLTLDGAPFTSGRTRFLDASLEGAEPTAKIYVKILPEGVESPVVAQLDTGAPWSILETEIAEAIGVLDEGGVPTTISSRVGDVSGHLVRIPLTLLADEGSSLGIDATVFVSREWPRGSFLGYSGLLESIRFALDPQANQFYFGGYTE